MTEEDRAALKRRRSATAERLDAQFRRMIEPALLLERTFAAVQIAEEVREATRSMSIASQAVEALRSNTMLVEDARLTSSIGSDIAELLRAAATLPLDIVQSARSVFGAAHAFHDLVIPQDAIDAAQIAGEFVGGLHLGDAWRKNLRDSMACMKLQSQASTPLSYWHRPETLQESEGSEETNCTVVVGGNGWTASEEEAEDHFPAHWAEAHDAWMKIEAELPPNTPAELRAQMESDCYGLLERLSAKRGRETHVSVSGEWGPDFMAALVSGAVEAGKAQVLDALLEELLRLRLEGAEMKERIRHLEKGDDNGDEEPPPW